MNTQEQNFITILKDTMHPTLHMSSLVTPNWSEILSIASKQNLFPLVYNAAARYDTFAEYDEARPDLFVRATAAMSLQIQKTDAFLDLYRAFIKVGEPPIVMKGIVCRSLYKDGQDFRASGDEDLLIEKENYDIAEEILTNAGYIKEDKKFDASLSHMQEVTFTNPDTGLVIELHINPFGTSDNIRLNMNNWFLDVFSRTEEILVDGVLLRTMAPTDNLLFLIFHAFKHFISRGFGIRLMLDALLYAEKYYDSIDWEYIRNGLRNVGAESFFSDMIVVGNLYLGFKLTETGHPTCPDDLLDDMFQMGVFGNSTKEDSGAGAFMSMAVNDGNLKSMKRNRAVDMLHMVFLSWKTWLTLRPYLADKPYLLPVEWFKRVGRYLKKKDKVRYTESWNTAERRLELLKKYNIV
ncbi:MAG: nucleotidyltransferase family protein [Oscillospiraceae bacterium]|nr:nucleotidyltransferase family protein [Oscillospiraceae bacterium]